MSAELSKINDIIKDYSAEKGNLMSVLHRLQKESGNYLPECVMKEVAKETGIPLNKLYGFVSFYTMFSTKKRGKHLIRICKDGPCNFKGGKASAELLKKELGIGIGETTADGKFTIEETACLGTCTAAPAIMVNDEVYPHVCPASLGDVLKKYR